MQIRNNWASEIDSSVSGSVCGPETFHPSHKATLALEYQRLVRGGPGTNVNPSGVAEPGPTA